MSKKLDDLTIDDLLEPCERCAAAKESGVQRKRGPDQTKEFSLRDAKSCAVCHGTKLALNKIGLQIKRLAVEMRDRGYLSP
jgi:hypothetical protein